MRKGSAEETASVWYIDLINCGLPEVSVQLEQACGGQHEEEAPEKLHPEVLAAVKDHENAEDEAPDGDQECPDPGEVEEYVCQPGSNRANEV